MRLDRSGPPDTLITLIDMDHFVEDTLDANSDTLVSLAYSMHDHIIEVFHDHVVTPEAIEAWR